MVEQEEEGREAVWVSGDPLRPDRLGGWSLPRRRMTRRRRRRRTTATGCQVIPPSQIDWGDGLCQGGG